MSRRGAIWLCIAMGTAVLAGCATSTGGTDATSSGPGTSAASGDLSAQTRAQIVGTSTITGLDPQIEPWPRALDTAPPTLTLAEDGSVAVYTGCNRGAGTYEVSGTTVTMGPIAITRMACSAELMAVENRITGLLSGPLEVRGPSASVGSSGTNGTGAADWELRGQSGALLLRGPTR